MIVIPDVYSVCFVVSLFHVTLDSFDSICHLCEFYILYCSLCNRNGIVTGCFKSHSEGVCFC